FPYERMIAESFPDTHWGCNVDNAVLVQGWVDQLYAMGAHRVAVVAHSMGGLSSRYFMKDLNGTSKVSVYVTLGTMHHGLDSPCLSPVPVCVWQELCAVGSFIADLNATPATPGPARWVSIFSHDDMTVPPTSSELIGAENIELSGLDHGDLPNSEMVYDL